MRDKLPRGPDGKSLSIAAPASYWYLKSFPIDKMADVIDYIVYSKYLWELSYLHSRLL